VFDIKLASICMTPASVVALQQIFGHP
jgi:hypothetical protein